MITSEMDEEDGKPPVDYSKTKALYKDEEGRILVPPERLSKSGFRVNDEDK